jgi:hypothetical protein
MKLENYLRGGRRSSLGANGGLHAQESVGGWLGNGEVESKERDREEKRREEKRKRGRRRKKRLRAIAWVD